MPHPEEAGLDEQAAEARAMELQAADQAGAVGAVGAQAPMADEPLEPADVAALHENAVRAANELSGGQLGELPSPPPAEGPLQQLPAPTFAIVAALSELVSQVAPDQAFDPMELARSSRGIKELSGIVTEIGASPQIRKAAQAPAPPPAPEAPAPPPRDVGQLVPEGAP